MVVPVAAASLLEPLDREHFWRGESLQGASPRKGEWEAWSRCRGSRKPGGQHIFCFPTLALTLDAAVSGQGIGPSDYRLAARDIENGGLVHLEEGLGPNDRAFYVVYRKGSPADARIKVFDVWFRSTLV